MFFKRQQKEKGIVALFKRPNELICAAKTVRDRHWLHFDCFMPYPIHGLDEAMRIPRSKVPWVTLTFGLLGCFLGYFMQYWMSAIDWPINVGGKPLNSWPAFIPITFECTILLAGISTTIALLFVSRLPNVKARVFDPEITNNRFAIFVSETNSGYEREAVSKLMTDLGAYEVRMVE